MKEIEELRALNKDLDAGRVTPEDIAAKLGIYKAVLGRMRLVHSVGSTLLKHANDSQRNKAIRDLNATGLFPNQNERFQLADVKREDENIMCPVQEKDITRADCLSFSGEASNYEDCKDCDNFKINRRMLMPGPALHTA